MVGKAVRLLAPIALAAVAVGVYLIVQSTVAKPHPPTTQSQTTLQRRPDHARHRKPRPKYYVVKPGDTLSLISQKTGVALGRLTALNPSVSAPPYSLQTGQRLRLRR
ncbi:MAG: LysM peptidoglycan-binding domain-containing protein [Solirubrobacteraceae bacterium]